MLMINIQPGLMGDYIEEGYEGSNEFLPSDTYGKILDTIVVACIDILLIHDDKVIIAKRDQYPQADWWLLGGRMRTGETMTQSASRLIKVETALNIEDSRFTYLTSFIAAWKKRAHEPEDNGTHTMSAVFWARIDDSEFEKLQFNKEYSEWKETTVDELLDSSLYHPAIVQCANELKSLGL
jgi:ADP-ribose pyrophosphatase YjhB (NUDIX family)